MIPIFAGPSPPPERVYYIREYFFESGTDAMVLNIQEVLVGLEPTCMACSGKYGTNGY
jgi:hypothetical protein